MQGQPNFAAEHALRTTPLGDGAGARLTGTHGPRPMAFGGSLCDENVPKASTSPSCACEENGSSHTPRIRAQEMGGLYDQHKDWLRQR